MEIILKCPNCGYKGEYGDPIAMIVGQTLCHQCAEVLDLRDMDFLEERVDPLGNHDTEIKTEE